MAVFEENNPCVEHMHREHGGLFEARGVYDPELGTDDGEEDESDDEEDNEQNDLAGDLRVW